MPDSFVYLPQSLHVSESEVIYFGTNNRFAKRGYGTYEFYKMSNLIATVSYHDSHYLIAYENKQLKVYNMGDWRYSSK